MLEDNICGRVLLADLGHTRELSEAKKLEIFQISQFSTYSNYRHEFYVAKEHLKLSTIYGVTTFSR